MSAGSSRHGYELPILAIENTTITTTITRTTAAAIASLALNARRRRSIGRTLRFAVAAMLDALRRGNVRRYRAHHDRRRH
jgi:hypothetical protein